MKVYDHIYASHEYMDTPSWLAVKLSPEDEANIAQSRDLLRTHPFLTSLNIALRGFWDMEDVDGKWRADGLLVGPNNVTFSATNHWEGGAIEVNLDTVVSTDWVWDDATETVIQTEEK